MSVYPDDLLTFEDTCGPKTSLCHFQTNVRIASDGTPEGTNVEALGKDGEWVLLRGCVAASLAPPSDGAQRRLVLTIIDPITNIVGALDVSTVSAKD